MKFIRSLFKEYDGENFVDALEVVNIPQMILFQILFWIICYYVFYSAEGHLTTITAIFEALFYAFGGLVFYLLFAVATMFISAIMHKRPAGIIIVILGIIGTVFAFMRLTQ